MTPSRTATRLSRFRAVHQCVTPNDDERHDADDADRDVREEHPEREAGRVELVRVDPVHRRDDEQIDARRGEKREPGEDDVEQDSQARTDGRDVGLRRRGRTLLDQHDRRAERVQRRGFAHGSISRGTRPERSE